jgi:hypothetical protein
MERDGFRQLAALNASENEAISGRSRWQDFRINGREQKGNYKFLNVMQRRMHRNFMVHPILLVMDSRRILLAFYRILLWQPSSLGLAEGRRRPLDELGRFAIAPYFIDLRCGSDSFPQNI